MVHAAGRCYPREDHDGVGPYWRRNQSSYWYLKCYCNSARTATLLVMVEEVTSRTCRYWLNTKLESSWLALIYHFDSINYLYMYYFILTLGLEHYTTVFSDSRMSM